MVEFVEKLNFFNENSNPDKLCIQWFPVNRLLKTVKTLKYLNKRQREIVIYIFFSQNQNLINRNLMKNVNTTCCYYMYIVYFYC